MSKYLSGGRVNVASLQEHLAKTLLNLVEKCDGKKAIVWDDALNSLFGLMNVSQALKERNVVDMYRIQPGKLPSVEYKNIIFISRPLLHLIDMISSNIHEAEKKRDRKDATKYHLFFVPRISLFCKKRLESKGVYGNFTIIAELPCLIYPLDNDLMSMEFESTYQDFYVDKDPSSMYQVAEAIIQLEGLYGRAGRVVGKGEAVKHVWDIVKRLRKSEESASVSLVDTMVLIDRATDLLSPLATQLTYGGLIDELYQIKTTTVYLPGERFASLEGETNDVMSEKQVVLNSGDTLYTEIRDKNFNGVGSILNRKAKEISAQFEERPHFDQSVQNIKQFMAKLPHMVASRKSLSIHTTIAEMIREVTDSTGFLESLQLEQELMLGVDTDKVQKHIENLIAHQHPLIKVLRLICLQCATNSGLKQKVLEHYIREIVQTYGFQHILTLSKLEKAGLLKVQTNSRCYTILRKTLKLTVEDDNEVSPSDINFVHSVYAPLSIRLVQAASKQGGWNALGDVLDQLPGPSFEEFKPKQNFSQRRDSIGSQTSLSDRPRIVLVFFVGGCTLAEIAALRFLSQKDDATVEYVIATTKIINGSNFIKSLQEKLD